MNLVAAKLLRLTACLSIGVVAAAAAGTTARAGDEPRSYTFRFAPTDGQVWIKSVVDEQIRDFGDKAEGLEQHTETRLEQRYVQGEAGSWELVQVAKEINMSIGGVETFDPALETILGHEIGLGLDDKGLAVSHRGFDRLMRRFEREADPATYQRVVQSMTAESMGMGEITGWNQGLRFVAGKTVTEGDVWGVLDQDGFQSGVFATSGVIDFEGWTEIGDESGLKFTYRFDSGDQLYNARQGEFDEVVSLRPMGAQYAPHNLEVEGYYTWVVDPETSQPLYQVQEKKVSVPIGTAGGPRGTITSTSTWRWSKAQSSDSR